MLYSLKEEICKFGFRLGVKLFLSDLRFCSQYRRRQLRHRIACWINPEFTAMWQEKCELAEQIRQRSETALKKQRMETDRLQMQVQSLEKMLRDEMFNKSHLNGKLAQIFLRSDETLREQNKWGLCPGEDGKWEVVTGICSLGGCDMETFLLFSEREALLYSALLTTLGYYANYQEPVPQIMRKGTLTRWLTLPGQW